MPQPPPHLTAKQVQRLIVAAGQRGRHPLRDQLLLRLIYRHGLRASEVCALRWSHIDLLAGLIHAHRQQSGTPGAHKLARDERTELRQLHAERTSSAVFISERGGALSPDMVARIVERAAETAKLGFHVHPQMLRHATGYALADEDTDVRLIQDLLGHASLTNTARYVQSGSPRRLASVRVR